MPCFKAWNFSDSLRLCPGFSLRDRCWTRSFSMIFHCRALLSVSGKAGSVSSLPELAEWVYSCQEPLWIERSLVFIVFKIADLSGGPISILPVRKWFMCFLSLESYHPSLCQWHLCFQFLHDCIRNFALCQLYEDRWGRPFRLPWNRSHTSWRWSLHSDSDFAQIDATIETVGC